MKKATLFGGTLLAAGMGANAAAQNVMDFQSLEAYGGGFAYHGTSYSANGFTISKDPAEPFDFATPHVDNGTFYQGSTMMFNNTVGGVITLTQDNGNPFSMDSIVIASLFVGGASGVDMVGNLNGGGTVNASFVVSNGGVGGETFSFAGLGFNNLDSLVWVQDSGRGFHQFDDITIIPAPASVAMLGLGGLVATRRRR